MERLTKRKLSEDGRVLCNIKHGTCNVNPDCNDSCMYGTCKWNKEALLKLKEYEDTELEPDVCKNYKLFEDECISEGITFKDILRIKDILKGMTCETCRNTGMCSIELDYGVKYCSDWEKKHEV